MSATVIKCVAVAVVLQLLAVVSVTSSRRMFKELLDIEDNEFFRCKQTSRKLCCGNHNIMKLFFDNKDAEINNCVMDVSNMFKTVSVPTVKQDLFSIEAVKILKKKQFCLHECIGKKAKMLNEDGSLDQSALVNQMENIIFKEQWQKDNALKALNKCMQESYIPWPEEEVTQRCNPVYVQFQHCMWLQYESNCPKEYQKPGNKCNKLRDRYKMQTLLY